MSFWLYLIGFIVVVLAVAVGAIFLGAKSAPRKPPVGPLVLFLLTVFCVDRLPMPPSFDAVVDYMSMAVVLYFLYRSGPMLRNFVYKRSN